MIKGIVQNGHELPKMDQNDQNGAKRPKKSQPLKSEKSALKLKSIYKFKMLKIVKIYKFDENRKSWKIVEFYKNQ